ncbi:MAG: hypothetical protein AAF403_03565 [Pseudomonadota bacterium]
MTHFTMLFLRGDVGKNRLPIYSNGVRQSLYRHALEGNWRRRYNILIGDRSDINGDYSALLAQSKYCVVATGSLLVTSCCSLELVGLESVLGDAEWVRPWDSAAEWVSKALPRVAV